MVNDEITLVLLDELSLSFDSRGLWHPWRGIGLSDEDIEARGCSLSQNVRIGRRLTA
jgi:hypothetical protein